MPYRLKKDYKDQKQGTICEVYVQGAFFIIKNKLTKKDFACFSEIEKSKTNTR